MTPKLGPSKACPCGSQKPYGDCCRPAHRGEREPASAEALMRSRYSAFALGEVEWLVTSLSSDHEDRAAPLAALVQALREACRANRYLGLEIRHVEEDAARGQATVRFFARVFTRGKDVSFEETSTFVREGGAWRYSGRVD